MEKIKKGDKVIVCKESLASYNLIGVVQNNCYYDWQLCTVLFEDWNGQGSKKIDFRLENIKLYTGEKGETKMALLPGFKRIAIVNLFEDSSKKDYQFALYDDEYSLLVNENGEIKENVQVAVETRTKCYPVLGKLKEIKEIKMGDSTAHITAQVMGIVDLNNYESRKAELKRQAEIAQKKAAIEEELNKEILKRKSLEYYAKMAEEYSDNPKLQELVSALKELGE